MSDDSGGIASKWLRSETPQHLRMLTRVRERIERRLDREDRAAAESGREADEVPDRDVCRAIQRYQASFTALLVEERERAKLALAVKLKGGAGAQILTDEELEAGMRELAAAALKELPIADLAAELARRGIRIPEAPDDHGDDDS